MQTKTTRFGVLDHPEDACIDFPKGLFGFEHIRRYVVVNDRAPEPFQWLQAVGQPELAFVILDPRVLRPDYRVQLGAEDARALGAPRPQDLDVHVIIGVPDDPRQMTANLKGPIVVHKRRRLGRQVILAEKRWSPRTPVVADTTSQNPVIEMEGP